MINITQQILFFNLVSRALFFLLFQIVWVSATVVLTHFLFTPTLFTGDTVHRRYCSPEFVGTVLGTVYGTVLGTVYGTVLGTVYRTVHRTVLAVLFCRYCLRYCSRRRYCSPATLFRFCRRHCSDSVLPLFQLWVCFCVVPLYPLVGILLLLFHGREEKFDFLCIFWFSHHYV